MFGGGRDSFIRNRRRMAHPALKIPGLPISSSAVESAVRRVINLRLKGACVFWYKENAEKMLMLRAFYKSGRWNWNWLKRMGPPLSVARAGMTGETQMELVEMHAELPSTARAGMTGKT